MPPKVDEVKEDIQDAAQLFNIEAKSVIELYGIDLDMTNPRNVRHKIRYLNKLPITYSGAVRENIDPGYKYSDKQIFDIMEKLSAFSLLGIHQQNLKQSEVEAKRHRSTKILPEISGAEEIFDSMP